MTPFVEEKLAMLREAVAREQFRREQERDRYEAFLNSFPARRPRLLDPLRRLMSRMPSLPF